MPCDTIDITLQDNSYEVGLGWLVDPDQRADLIGKDALKRIRSQGVKRKQADRTTPRSNLMSRTAARVFT